jgi:anti-sigma factor RsiW
MSCEETTPLLVDRLKGLISTADEQRLEAHLSTCAACRAEAAVTAAVWSGLATSEPAVPHERLRARFHAALAAHEARAEPHWTERVLAAWWPRQPALQAGFAVALALVGVLVGRQLPSPVDGEIAALRAEVRTVGLALLDHQSAAERLLGVEWSQGTTQSPEVVNALLERVQYDTNSSVRLAAIEALGSQLDRPEVGAGLAAALALQDAPLIQVALIDALLASGTVTGLAAVRAVLGRDEIDPAVREYVQEALNKVDAEPGAEA